MLRIAICDDNKFDCSDLEKKIISSCNAINLSYEIDVFWESDQLIELMRSDCCFDLLFLDIEIDSKTGIDIAQHIRNCYDNHWSKIVFVSSKTGYELLMFDVQPLNFLTKPIDSEKLSVVINLAAKLLKKENSFFEFVTGYSNKKVLIKDILYFESSLKKMKIVTRKTVEFYYGNFNDLKENLPAFFFSPHRSFFVNYQNVEMVTTKQITFLGSDETVPISRGNIKKIQEWQMNVEKENMNADF